MANITATPRNAEWKVITLTATQQHGLSPKSGHHGVCGHSNISNTTIVSG